MVRWYLKLKCANCGEVPDKWQYVDQTEKQPLKGGRGEACAVIKCKVRAALLSIIITSVIISSALWQRKLHPHLAGHHRQLQHGGQPQVEDCSSV